jgi:hypothetical protein
MGITAVAPILLQKQRVGIGASGREQMERHLMLKFLFAMVVAIAGVVAINTLAAMPKRPPISEAATTGPIFQHVFQKVY